MKSVSLRSSWFLTLFALLVSSVLIVPAESVFAQGPAFGGDPFTLTSKFQSYDGGNKGLLTVTAKVASPWHIYSLTQPEGGPLRSEIIVEGSKKFSMSGEFEPDSEPAVKQEDGFDVPTEYHEGTVNWSVPIEFAADTKPEDLAIEVGFAGLRCADAQGCVPIRGAKAIANYAGAIDAPFRSKGSHVLISGKLTYPEGKTKLAAGDEASVEITLEPVDGHHVYQYAVAADPEGKKKYSLIGLTKLNGWAIGDVETIPPAADKVKTDHGVTKYKGPVTFKVPFTISKDAEAKEYKVGGVLGFQTCTDTGCDKPSGSRWEVVVPVGVDSAASTNLRITEDPLSYENAVAKEVEKANEANGVKDAGAWTGYSTWVVLMLAFVAGFILNFMPCVLPVVGLKIMSFVHMAGENPRRVFMLNIVFIIGMLSVFMTFAALAVMFNFGWGEAYRNLSFKVIMISIVFAFGLSFFGIWEIPMPGFVESDAANDLANKEGYVGQFFKGILTTLLATPCSGPMLIPAVVWAMAQPSAVTFSVFLCLGLGMAFPYIVVGFFPKLAGFLPKPGPWMDTFKNVMGFVMLATTIFLINGVGAKYGISVLTLLLGIGAACWWIGRTELHEPAVKQIKAWASGLAMVAVSFFVAFGVLLPWHELDYKPYSNAAVAQHLAEGRTVLVDFTADW